MKKLFCICFSIFSFYLISAQEHSHSNGHALFYPNIDGYVSLKTDFHIHTVFSDGNVWPTIRVQEALRENLDAISLTDHLEYQPHKDDIPHPDRNRSYEIALAEAKEHDLLIVRGSEITRSAPVGHNNAIFIENANPLLTDKAEKAFSEAKKQNAFVFWNHPAWHRQTPKGNPILSNFQKERIKKGELHGIEVINQYDYSKESLALALEQNLTIMGTSDVHGLIDWDYTEKGNNRPITLVFAKEKSLNSMQEALFAGRTVAVYNSLLIGKAEFLNPLLKASIKVHSATYLKETQVLAIEIENISSSDLLFENSMPFSFYSKSPIFNVAAGTKETLQIKTLTELTELNLRLTALGAYTAPEEHPVIEWKVTISE
ncbi:PHP domain-containing protein [Aurantibacter crassamenti]|uniref:Sb-PDE family phosphodiesterase n=1 Tax=Aurantibacter crassamenti TaxID=1837375 RepID=UPI001939E972|nr:Sb-PDE family phosphodiesterase [Aurantibacter crassamenti]MBM1106203.1 PHP domain-containing protein [Aurantibacter crassamenti]